MVHTYGVGLMKLTVKEYSSRFKISVQAVYQKLNSGALKSVIINGRKYVIVDKEDIKSVKQPLVKAVEQATLKYLFKQVKIQEKIIERLEKKLDKKDKDIKKLNKQLLKSSSSEKDTLLSFISELKQLKLQAPSQVNKEEEIIDIKEEKPKSKKKHKKKGKKK